MAKERTLSIIKPDAVRKNLIGEIDACIEKSGFIDCCYKNVENESCAGT